MAAYSFRDVSAAIDGPGGTFQLANGSGAAEEGISWERTDDRNMMQTGADGSGQHSLRATRSGTITVRLLKTSPVNASLTLMFNLQTASSGLWGSNIIRVTQTVSGDIMAARQVAFKKFPNRAHARDAGTLEWTFDALFIDETLGTY